MPFIKTALNEGTEDKPVPEGEYDLRIIKHTDKKSKAGNDMTEVLIKIEDPDHPDASIVRHYIVYPGEDTPADQRRFRLRDINRFLALFGIPHEADGFDSDDLDGAEGRCFVAQEENEESGDMYNTLRLPRMED